MIVLLRILLALAAMSSVVAQPYTDPRLLDVPWGNYSFERQAWRGYLDTVPAVDVLGGLGVVWGATPAGRSAEQLAADVAAAGFRRVRIEIPWGSVTWDETGFVAADAARLARTLTALRKHGLRPLILLNAHHAQPCPVQWRELRVLRAAAAGSRAIVVDGPPLGNDWAAATIMSFADGVTPGPLVEGVGAVPQGQELRLSKGVARPLGAGDTVRVALLRYAPLHPVGTPQFEHTVAGWLRYAALTTDFVQSHYGSDDFDIEVWNELTFGSAFLNASSYGTAATAAGESILRRGGRAWELAHRTVQALERDHPRTRVLWGFSNTTFFHTPIAELPPQLDGQSYHPYGTGRRCFADLVRGKERWLLDAVVPAGCAVQPEGSAHGWQQTESLVRLLAPAVRDVRPPGSTEFRHYITEHGFRPAEIGIEGTAAAQRAKEKFLLRAPLFWLNKGVTALYVYSLYDSAESGFGVLAADGAPTPAMASLRRLTQRLAGSQAIDVPRPLTITLHRVDPEPGAPIAGAPQEASVAVLPMQLGPRRFALAAYVMTQDFPRDLPPQSYDVSVTGVRGTAATVTFYSPDSATVEPSLVLSASAGELTVRVSLTDVPRLIEIEEQASANDAARCTADARLACGTAAAERQPIGKSE